MSKTTKKKKYKKSMKTLSSMHSQQLLLLLLLLFESLTSICTVLSFRFLLLLNYYIVNIKLGILLHRSHATIKYKKYFIFVYHF